MSKQDKVYFLTIKDKLITSTPLRIMWVEIIMAIPYINNNDNYKYNKNNGNDEDDKEHVINIW